MALHRPLSTEKTEKIWPRIRKRIAAYREEMVAMQRDLTALPALGPENGGDGESRRAEYLEKCLTSLSPAEVHHIDCPDRRVSRGVRPNLLALFSGADSQRTVWILSHLDVVPAGDQKLWRTDPFVLTRKGDILYGRGVEDNQHGLVSSFFAVKAFRDLGVVPACNIGLLWVSDEETGSRRGLEYVLRRKRRLFQKKDLIIVPDAGNREGTLIEVAEKSLLWLKVTLIGKQSHGSRPDLGRNTLRGTAQVILALEGLARTFSKKDPRFDLPFSTFEPTRKEANVPNINTIPGRDVFYLDCRVLPEYPLERVIDAVQKKATTVAKKAGLRITVEVINRVQAPPPTDGQAPVVSALQKAIFAVYRRKAVPCGIGGATVAAFFRRIGLPAAVWCSSSETAHQPNEYCRLSRLIGDAQVFAHVFCHA